MNKDKITTPRAIYPVSKFKRPGFLVNPNTGDKSSKRAVGWILLLYCLIMVIAGTWLPFKLWQIQSISCFFYGGCGLLGLGISDGIFNFLKRRK